MVRGLDVGKEAIYRVFKDTVFRDRAWPNPTRRKLNGDAVIYLKPGTQTKKQQPIHMAGERREAFLNLTKGRVADKKIEPGTGPWYGPGFCVAKKGGNGA